MACHVLTSFLCFHSTTEPSSSTATITNPNTATTGTNQSTVDDIFGSAATGVAPSTQQAAPSKPPSKGTYDDLSDFEGLEDAKEGSADDDFANISRSGLDDFNPMFDNSPPASQAKSESTAFGNESSFDFISANSATGASAAGSGAQPKGGDNNDWDAIFSSLDSPSAAAAVPASNNDLGKVDSNNNSSNLSVTDRPHVGRALTEEGHHDDPILKDLISMGYQRSAAVSALEKYDYNLERVSKLRPLRNLSSYSWATPDLDANTARFHRLQTTWQASHEPWRLVIHVFLIPCCSSIIISIFFCPNLMSLVSPSFLYARRRNCTFFLICTFCPPTRLINQYFFSIGRSFAAICL